MAAEIPITRHERRRQRRRQRLIEAARAVIARKGVAGFTIADVTEAADVAVGSFYTYFDDKDDLLEAAVWEDLQRLGDPASHDLAATPPLERARLVLLETYAFVEHQRGLMRAVFGPDHLAEHYERGLKLIEERVAHGLRIQPGLIPEEDIPWLAALLAGLTAGGIRFALNHPDVSAAEMSDRTLRLIRPLQAMYRPHDDAL